MKMKKVDEPLHSYEDVGQSTYFVFYDHYRFKDVILPDSKGNTVLFERMGNGKDVFETSTWDRNINSISGPWKFYIEKIKIFQALKEQYAYPLLSEFYRKTIFYFTIDKTQLFPSEHLDKCIGEGLVYNSNKPILSHKSEFKFLVERSFGNNCNVEKKVLSYLSKDDIYLRFELQGTMILPR